MKDIKTKQLKTTSVYVMIKYINEDKWCLSFFFLCVNVKMMFKLYDSHYRSEPRNNESTVTKLQSYIK